MGGAGYCGEPDGPPRAARRRSHAFFGPGHRPQARRALGLPLDGRLLLFVGRIQPLRVRRRGHRDAGSCRRTAVRRTASSWWAAPAGPTGRRPCRACTTWPTPAVCASTSTPSRPNPMSCCLVVPGRRRVHGAQPLRVFGLVALEAAACGTPVVASAVGGLTTLVDHGRTGYLVDGQDRGAFAAAVDRVVGEPLAAERLSTASVIGPAVIPGAAPPTTGRSWTTNWPRAGSWRRLSADGRRGRAARRSPRGRGDGGGGGQGRRLGRP